jgi:serine/threonine-protein kinase
VSSLQITGENWETVSRLLDEAFELPAAQRAAWMVALDPQYGAVRPVLEKLLHAEAMAETEDFLEALPQYDEDTRHPMSDGSEGDAFVEGAEVGPYRLRREIGHGGMGAVWLAERTDGSLKRPVALKLLRPGFHDRQFAERFGRERDILAGLTHPNIARLYDAGITADGQPFLALEYVEGATITTYCDRHALDLRQRIDLFLQVLDAVQYAHRNLVVHRDLKPSNILVNNEGQIRLLDFGIAKLLVPGQRETNETELTRLGGRAHTPDYASPEQIAGAPITTGSDIYSLGVVLYELFCGKRPYKVQRESSAALEEAILSADPAPPSRVVGTDGEPRSRGATRKSLVRKLKGDLDTIVLKALKKNPADRYATADALAQDLRHHLNGEPVDAQPDSIAYRSAKFVLRNRLAVGAATVTALALLAGVVGTTWQAVEASRQRDAARFEAANAEASSEFMSLMLEEVGEKGQPLPAPEMLNRAVQLLEKQYGDDPRFVSSMLVQLSRRYMDLGQYDRAVELLARSASIAESQNDDALLARALCASVHARKTSRAASLIGSAESELTRGIAALARVRNPRVDLQVDCLRGEADLAEHQGNTASAIAMLTRAHELHRKSGENRGLQYTAVLVGLGGLYLQQSRLPEAYATSLEVIEAFDRNGRGGTLGKVSAEANLAFTLGRMGEVQAAARLEQHVLQRSIALGTAKTAGRPSYYINYAASLLRLEQAHPALDLLQGIRERLHLEKNSFFTGIAEFYLGQAFFLLDEADAARSHLAEAQRLWQPETNANRRWLSLLAEQRVRMSLAEGNNAAARAGIDAILQHPQHPQRRGGELRSVLALAAAVYLQEGQPERAAAFAADAYDIAQKMSRQVDQSADVGETAYLLSKARYELGRSDEAIPLLQQAVKSLGNGLGLEHRLTREAGDLLARLERTDSRAPGTIAK